MILVWILFLTVGLPPLYSHPYETHAKTLQAKSQNLAKTTAPQTVPGFQTERPPESHFFNPEALAKASPQGVQQNLYTQGLKGALENRPYFRLDPVQDPLFENTQTIIEGARELLARGEYVSARTPGTLLKKCEESRPDTTYTCTHTLLEPTVHLEPAKYSHYWCSAGNHQPDDPRCSAKTYYSPARKYREEVVTVTQEKWTSTCDALEARARQGLCRLKAKKCPRGPETRSLIVSGGAGEKPLIRAIQRPCWQYELAYQCDSPSKNTCEPLRQAKCSQVGSRCLEERQGVCVIWEQTFKCPHDGVPQEEKHVFKPSSFEVSKPKPLPENTQELGHAIAQLEILNTVQREIRAADGSNLPLGVFKGSSNRCTIAFANFKNCCAQEKGWGLGLHLAGCSGEDQHTNQAVEARKCVALGTYCAEKVLGVCLRKKRTYCCFGSKLARILHEQGRRFGWGSAENPDCRGFTIQELAALNFDTFDFREAFEDVLASMTLPTQSPGVAAVNRRLSDRMSQMTSPFHHAEKGDY